jgi:ATP-dependent Lhr-like helicase
LLDVIEQLQGAALPASILEQEILGARLARYSPDWLDTLAAAGEIRWVGVETLGRRDGRVALYLTDQIAALLPDPAPAELSERERAIVDWLTSHGASFFDALHDAAGGGFPAETVDALWALVWRGLITNDTFFALRAFTSQRDSKETRRRARSAPAAFRSRRLVPRTAEGRWTLVRARAKVSGAEKMTSMVRQLLARHGVLTREALASEGLKGGFSGIYPALKAMDDAGRVRRGYFVAGLGATQFALPGALDLLRSLREAPAEVQTAAIAATDPANPFGTSLPWPVPNLSRVVGATVVLVDGVMAAYIARGHREISVHLPDEEPFRSRIARGAAAQIAAFARGDTRGRRAMFVTTINDEPAGDHPFAPYLQEAGFLRGALGLQLPRPAPGTVVEEPEEVGDDGTDDDGDDEE